MAIGGLSSSRKLLARKRLQKRSSARRILMENLESRQLMAVGPQLLGIQPNSGNLLDSGEVLHVSPREFTLRFDDAAGIDAKTLGGIRIVRSGADGVFERASMATDFGTNGATLVEFYAQTVGEAGNGITVKFARVNRSDSRAPIITTSGREVTIQLNSNPALETRVEDLVRALDPATVGSSSLIYALRLRGSQTVGIAATVDTTRSLVLSGANSAKLTTSFGQSSGLQVRLTSVESGNSGLGISVVVTGRDRGGAGLPIISVDGKRITVELNTNSRFPTTVQEFVDALNNNSQTQSLVQATLVSGSGATRLGALAINYSPLQLSGVLDIEVVPAYVGLGDNGRDVIVRFAEALPDDQYRIEILGTGVRTLRNVNGQAFNAGRSVSIPFELDLGAQVQSIVPQPVTRSTSGSLVHQRNQIEVYFNDDDLIDVNQVVSVNGLSIADLRALRSPLYFQNGDTIVFAAGAVRSTSAINANFYQLFHTAGTLTNADDTRVLPSSVRYYPDSDRVTLTFARNLDELTNSANVQLPLGELRLRIGTNESVPLPPVSVTPAADAADTFAAATNLSPNWTPGVVGSPQSVIINSAIVNTSPYVLDFPGGSDEPGNRQIRMQDNLRLGADTVDGTQVIFYNFQSQLGSSGNLTFSNAITEQQKQRVREIFSLYENYLGVRFVESTNLGMTIGVGDMRAIVPFPDLPGSNTPGVVELNGPGFTTFEAGTLATNNQLATVLDVQDFSDSTRSEFGGPFMRAAMQAIGRLLGLGNADELPSLTIQSDNAVFVPGVGTEIVLPGDGDIVHGQYLYRPDSKDIDLYQFAVPTAGRISIEAFAERMSQASLLDTTLRLYQQNSKGGWDEIAVNDDYFSSDSMIELELAQGNYIIGVSASGNSDYDPRISDSGLGGRSEGRYQLRMDFQPKLVNRDLMLDSTGTALDGDADGQPGGTQDFWFRPSGPSNTKFVDKSSPAAVGNGSLATPYKFIKDALAAAVPGDVVRIVGNGGADGLLSTPADNLAYEIGFDATQGRALPDGSTFDVPKDVAVIIDAGAVLKLRRARIGVGSTSASVDRSAGSLMVLGTPVLLNSSGAVIKDALGNNVPGSVYMTSLSDTTIGRSANASVAGTTPSAGDWGGIDFRNRIDAATPGRENLEAQGQFLNWVSNAQLRYGGGQVVIDSQSQVVTPIQMVDSRPSIAFTQITSSSDAAMSATPNSFLESNFNLPSEQGATSFSLDYNRVGPDIHNNRMTGNSLNGLQIRLRTGAGTQLERMTVQGRFDDLDIVHIIPENLEIAGSAGGAIQQIAAPSSTLVSLSAQTGGTLANGVYNYRFTFVSSAGVESPASEPTGNVFVNSFGGLSAVRLNNLPQGIRRIYRSSSTGNGPYTLVAELPAAASTYTDNGSTIGTPLTTELPGVISRQDARLAIDAGTVVKMQGSRIDVSLGGQLIAEGTDELPVVFTSIVDARYGAGGTFDTANRSGSQAAVAGDWGGIYVGHTSKASIDHAVIAYGGGTTRVEGGFADFNAVETQQGELRLANSRLENNATGAASATVPLRGGRLNNSAGTVFIRGSQPVIFNNIIVDSLGPAISTNVSSLNGQLVNDPGRSTGAADFFLNRVGNRGPLLANNRLEDNDINGVVVRGGQLSTEGVWDDTDIVHVVQSEIVVPDYHVYGGLRLTSAPAESLVVKLDGPTAGFTATGTPLDNANRIGGSVQLVGNPGYPVVLTSLEDCTVGAGFTPGGAAQNDTHNSGLCGPARSATFADVIVVMDESGSMFGAQQFSVGMIADLDAALLRSGIGASAAGANRFGLVGFGDNNEVGRSVPVGPNGELFGTAAQYGTAVSTLTINGAIEDGYDGIDEALENYAFRPNAEKFIILVTDEPRDIVNPSLTYNSVLADLRAEGVNLQGILGTFIVDQNFRSAIALDANNTAYSADGNGGFTTSPNGQFLFGTGSTITDYADMVFATGGIVGDIFQISAGGNTATSFSNALVSSIVLQAGGSLAAPGDWRSVLMDTYSNDRNVAVVNELESPVADSASSNNTTFKAQFLGNLAPNEKAGDENLRLGFQLQGVLSNPSDVDVYSFRANAGTEVWFDIDRTQNSLDTVIELVDANGRTLALSNDSYAEELNPALLQLQKAPELAAQSVNPLRKSSTDFYFTSAQGDPKDLFSTNPKDAGFRVRLPGENGLNNLYHVRVRSNNNLSQGSYQLQVRLSEVDEVPGSGAAYAEIRFAQNGLSLVGVPGNSPLLGESSEVEIVAAGQTNNAFANAQNLGNLLQTNRQALSVAGNLNSFTDVDWFSFDIDYQRLSATALREYFSTVIDVDYADGLGRPDTSIYVFDSAGNLILAGLNSNLVDDQASPGTGAGNSDLSRGSAGNQDPYIGAYELPSGRYFLAVTNSRMVPEVLATYTNPTSNAPGVRLQPIEGIQLIAEDHIGFSGGSTAVQPVTPVLFPIANLTPGVTAANDAIVDHTLGDVRLYVSQDVGSELTNLYLVNPFTGQTQGQVGRIGFDLQDIAMRDNGELRAFDRAVESQVANVDRDTLIDYINIDPGTAATTVTGPSGIQTFHIETTPGNPPTFAAVASDDGMNPEAFTFSVVGGQERGYMVANRPTPFGVQPSYFPAPAPLPNVGSSRPGPSYFTNVLFEFNENTGAATSAPLGDKTGLATGTGAGTQIRDRGYIETLPIVGNTTNPSLRSSILVGREVTLANPNGSPNRVIRDGNTFVLLDSVAFPAVFEFDLGPEVLVNYNPAAGRFVRDGMSFTLDGTTYEFDTGSVVLVNALSGGFLSDGSTVRIESSTGAQRIFEFDSNNSVLGAGNVRIPFSATNTQAELARALVTAVNTQVGFGVTANVQAGSNRVAFRGLSTTVPVQVTGSGLGLSGSLGVTPGAVRIPITEFATTNEFVDSIRQAVGGGITVSYDSGRMNFSGALNGTFTSLENAGIFTNLGSSGGVGAGNVQVRVLASDTAETVAARVAQAINSSLIPGLSATSSGELVQLSGGTILNDGPLASAGVSPGGIVTGVAIIGDLMFAVSNEGGLYRVNLNGGFPSQAAGPAGNVGTYITTSYDLAGIEFTGLVAGPSHASNGSLSQLLFGIDSAGNIHAFDTSGRLQPVFANGATSISTGVFGANGLAFSTLDFNLWHATGQRGGDPGHGLPNTPNDSRAAFGGGASLYFGYEDPATNGSTVSTGLNALTGAGSPGITDSYNFPGGAAGAIESAPFDLSTIGAGDLPTLYFNYRFDTEQASSDLGLGNSPTDYMRDALRIYAAGEDGNWILLATNNDPAPAGSNNGLADDELDTFVSGNPNVQRLFDNNGQWRQARVPLDLFAGQANVRLRVEFSSAGGFGYGLSGGRGPEIRTLPGDRLVDGETLVIGGEQFEIELGSTVNLAGGRAISNGDSITIDGTRYVFTDGSGPPPASPAVPVFYSTTDSAEDIALALQTAVLNNPAAPVIINGLNFSVEGNDVIDRAALTGINGDTMQVTGSGNIGDNASLASPGQDVDMVRVDLEAGATLTANAIGSGLDSFLRVFDAEGRPLRDTNGFLVENDNRTDVTGSTDSLLSFVAPYTGTYFIGVSGSGNQLYNAAVIGSASAGSIGNYNLVLNVVRKLVPVVSGNRLQLDGAKSVTLSPNSPFSLQGSLGSAGNAVAVTIDMTAAQVATALRQSVADRFANGQTSAYAIRNGDTIDLTGLTVLDAGSFGLTTSFVGDQFGAFNTSTNFDGSRSNFAPGTLGAQSNAFEGVYLDDFIIGIAGRGEMVLNATGANTTFVPDPQLTRTNPDQGNFDIGVGDYQFEIRGGETYGTPLLNGTTPSFLLDSAVPADSRQAEGISIRFNGASSLVAGQTFTVGDGTRVLTFELDDVNDTFSVQAGNIALPYNTALLNTATGAIRSESAQVIAARFRDIINSAAIQAQLELSAILSNNDRTGATSPTVVLFGNAAVEIPASIGTKIVSTGFGSQNRERPQGQVVIDSVRVSNSQGFGISIASAARDAASNAPQPGSPRNTITVNTDRLAPGAVVMNSELLFNNAGGISVRGDSATGAVPAAAVPFVRLVNNTIIGGTVSSVTSFVPTIYNSQVFDIGDLAFADAVSVYTPLFGGGPAPVTGLDVPANAVGAPNFSGSGEPLVNEGVVSLGRGGQLVLEFTDNLLTGSGDANPDLIVFEVGDSEEVLVEISADGNRYTAVGRASAASPTIDIDAFGFRSNSRIAFVRLTDVSNQGATTGNSVGADIDAVGAISSVAVDRYNAGGTGISVTSNSTATLLNNVIVNSTVGIDVDPSSASTVVGGTVFQRNTNNVARSATTGQFPTLVGANVPVFVSAGTSNIYPAPSSPIIDSSIDSLQDRQSLVAVKQPLGLAASPILAPQYDSTGQLRVDDPAVETPFGLGENVFKDRGAQDRADFVGPSVFLVQPADNDVAGKDLNSDLSVVELTGETLKYFDIQLIDGIEPSDPGRGSNVDDKTVTSSSVLVYRDNVPLVEGVDYSFGYNNTSGIIRLTPLAGIWRSESVYTIRFLNTSESAIVAKPAASYNDGDSFDIVGADGSRTTFELDLGYIVSIPSSNGTVANIVDGTTFTIDDGTRRVTFEFDSNSTFTSTTNRRIALPASATPAQVVTAIDTAISATSLAVTVTDLGNGTLQIGGSGAVVLLPQNSGLTFTGKPGVRSTFGLQIPLQAGLPVGVTDGQTFVIDRSGAPVTFELDTNGTVLTGNVPVRFVAGASASQIGAALVTAIQGSGVGLSPSYIGGGLVRLGGDANTRLTLTNTVLTQQGLPGQPAAVSIPLTEIGAIADISAEDVAAIIKSAIDAQNLTGVSTTQFGNRVVVEGARGLAGEGVGEIVAIRDHAGNTLKANQTDGTSTLTIFLGEGLDYGDAPAPKYASLADDGGPSHKVVDGLSLGVTVTPDADAKVPNLDSDDGVVFNTIVSAFDTTFTVSVTNTTGTKAYLSYWFDFNANGVFENSESVRQIDVDPTVGTVNLAPFTIKVPAAASLGTTYARFRLSTDRNAMASPTGAANDGEVEDFAITVTPNPYKNPSTSPSVRDTAGNNLDVNGDGFVSPIDALQIINYLSNPANPRQMTLPRLQTGAPFRDVNGDSVISPLDALLVISFLTRLRSGGGSGEGESIVAGGFNDLSAGEVGSGEGVVLSSDWAPGLENILIQSEGESDEEESEVSVVDVALLSTQDEDDDVSVTFQATGFDFNVVDEVIATTSVTEVNPPVSSEPVAAPRHQLLASYFRK